MISVKKNNGLVKSKFEIPSKTNNMDYVHNVYDFLLNFY